MRRELVSGKVLKKEESQNDSVTDYDSAADGWATDRTFKRTPSEISVEYKVSSIEKGNPKRRNKSFRYSPLYK